MPEELILPMLMRWIHILSAVVVVGSILSYRFVVLPAAKQSLEGEALDTFKYNLMKKWKLWLHSPIILFLISGFYYYMVVGRAMHEGESMYHMLFGIKFLLALIVFALYIVLTSTMKWSEKFRDNTLLWRLLILLTIIVVLVGGAMRLA